MQINIIRNKVALFSGQKKAGLAPGFNCLPDPEGV